MGFGGGTSAKATATGKGLIGRLIEEGDVQTADQNIATALERFLRPHFYRLDKVLAELRVRQFQPDREPDG